MGSSRYRLQLAVLLASLAFILTILGVYAYVGISYSEGQGLPWDRQNVFLLVLKEKNSSEPTRAWQITRERVMVTKARQAS